MRLITPLLWLRACNPRNPADKRNEQSYRRHNCNARRLRRLGRRVPYGGGDVTAPRLQARLRERGLAGGRCGGNGGPSPWRKVGSVLSPPPCSLAGQAALHGLVQTSLSSVGGRFLAATATHPPPAPGRRSPGPAIRNQRRSCQWSPTAKGGPRATEARRAPPEARCQ